MKSIKVAQIGVGYWGPNLLRNLVNNPKCDVKLVVDSSPVRRAFVNNLYPSIKIGTDANSIFDDNSITAVVIATPAQTHFELVMKALLSRKHVLVEKPMAPTTAQ